MIANCQRTVDENAGTFMTRYWILLHPFRAGLAYCWRRSLTRIYDFRWRLCQLWQQRSFCKIAVRHRWLHLPLHQGLNVWPSTINTMTFHSRKQIGLPHLLSKFLGCCPQLWCEAGHFLLLLPHLKSSPTASGSSWALPLPLLLLLLLLLFFFFFFFFLLPPSLLLSI